MTVYVDPVTGQITTQIGLDDLKDAQVENPVQNEGLFYDETIAKFRNQLTPPDSQQTIAGLSDTSVIAPQTDQALIWNGTVWQNQNQATTPPTLSDLTDTTITSPAAEDYFVYNGTAWINRVSRPITRTNLVPASFSLPRDYMFNGYTISTPTTFTLAAGSVDGMMATASLISDGVLTITWGPEFRSYADDTATLPTVLPVGVNVINFLYDGAENIVRVDIGTQHFKSDGTLAMTGDLNLAGNSINNVDKLTAEYILRAPFTAPTSGTFAPDFGERSDFSFGALTGDLTISNPTNQSFHQEGKFSINNSGGHTVTLGSNFTQFDGASVAIPTGRFFIVYAVYEPGIIGYSIRTL